MTQTLSIIIPAKNEQQGLAALLPKLRALYPTSEIIVVDDGSTDDTVDVCKANQVKVVSHAYSMGNGAAVKTGARAASGDRLTFMDADGQHDPEDIARLIEKLDEGFEMVVGARSSDSQASIGRWLGNSLYNRLASWVVGAKISDLTSGFQGFVQCTPRNFVSS
jgi:glycosyltransferase involved in cell wall biosynthesis